jgi:pentatricopeptide repeat protein
MIHFYLDSDVQAIEFFEKSLQQLADRKELYPPLAAEISERLVLQRLYTMLIESYLRNDQLTEAVDLYDLTAANTYDDIINPDFFVMIAQALAASDRAPEALTTLEHAAKLTSELEDAELREDSLALINDLIALINKNHGEFLPAPASDLPLPENTSQ